MAEVFWVVFPLYFLIFAYFNKSKHGIQFWDVGTLTSSDYLCGAWVSPKPLKFVIKKRTQLLPISIHTVILCSASLVRNFKPCFQS